MLKRIELRIIIRIVFLFITLFVSSFLLVKGMFIYVILIVPVLVYQMAEIYRFQRNRTRELMQFVESIRYRDFSRNFDVKHAPCGIAGS